jgi:hypothetical protein
MAKPSYTPSIPHHEISRCWPMLQGDRLEVFIDTVARYGLKQPIMLYEGRVLDGKNRLAACDQLGITPRTENFNGTFEEAFMFAVGMNTNGRQDLNARDQAVAHNRLADLVLMHDQGGWRDRPEKSPDTSRSLEEGR